MWRQGYRLWSVDVHSVYVMSASLAMAATNCSITSQHSKDLNDTMSLFTASSNIHGRLTVHLCSYHEGSFLAPENVYTVFISTVVLLFECIFYADITQCD